MNWPPDLTELHPYLSVCSPFTFPPTSLLEADPLLGKRNLEGRREKFVPRFEAYRTMDRVQRTSRITILYPYERTEC